MSSNGVGDHLDHEQLFDSVASLVKDYLLKNKIKSNKVQQCRCSLAS